jgi:uncharacterized protein YjbI with pentapeptide repeats
MKRLLILCLFLVGGLFQTSAIAHGPELSTHVKDSLKKIKATNHCRQCNLSDAYLPVIHLADVDLSGANLKNARLGGNLTGANLEGANLTGADLGGADLQRANLSGANLQRAYLSGVNLRGANLEGADLKGANLGYASLQWANLTEATLKGANLTAVNLGYTYLIGANLTVGAEWENVVAQKGATYTGDLINGMRHGQGMLAWQDGQKYVGDFVNGMPHGQGRLTWQDGQKYVGTYMDGLRHGQGTYTFSNGRKYVGEWRRDHQWAGMTYDEVGVLVSKTTKGIYCKVDNSPCTQLSRGRTFLTAYYWCLSGGKIKKLGQNSCRSRGGRVFESKDLAEQAKRDRQ